LAPIQAAHIGLLFAAEINMASASVFKDYVRYDEIEDVLTSTDLLALVMPRLNQQRAFWKWAVVATQNGLQGAIVCALHDTVGVTVLTEKSRQARLEWLANTSGKYPKERLEEFWKLLRRFLRENPSVKPSFAQLRNIYRLHFQLRNDFQHYKPGGWSIEKSYLTRT